MEDMVGSVEVTKWENSKGYVVTRLRHVVDPHGTKAPEEGTEINKYNPMCPSAAVDLRKVDDPCECLKANKVNTAPLSFYNEGSSL